MREYGDLMRIELDENNNHWALVCPLFYYKNCLEKFEMGNTYGEVKSVDEELRKMKEN